jgi:hypothetical protein
MMTAPEQHDGERPSQDTVDMLRVAESMREDDDRATSCAGLLLSQVAELHADPDVWCPVCAANGGAGACTLLPAARVLMHGYLMGRLDR